MLSEMAELKNKRIFGSVFEIHVNQGLRCQIDLNEDGARTFFDLYSAIFYGAAKLGTSLVQIIPSIMEAWGEPDLERANIVFKVCCLPMISIASRKISEGKGWAEAQRQEVTRSRFEDIASIIQTGIDISHCMNLDAQYNHDVDNKTDDSTILSAYAYLFNGKLREGLGLPVNIDWESLWYPLKSIDSFHISGGEYAEIITIAGLIADSGEIMFRAFEKYSAE